jgi:hypothetical protein
LKYIGTDNNCRVQLICITTTYAGKVFGKFIELTQNSIKTNVNIVSTVVQEIHYPTTQRLKKRLSTNQKLKIL